MCCWVPIPIWEVKTWKKNPKKGTKKKLKTKKRTTKNGNPAVNASFLFLLFKTCVYT